MILLTVGTLTAYNFDRLIKKMDDIAEKIDEDVIMQIGSTSYKPKNAEYCNFTSIENMDSLYNDARIVVCHAGVGSLLNALDYGKPIVAVPRREKYNEHFDDHQIEIAEKFEQEGLIKVVWGIENLESAIQDVSTFQATKRATDGMLLKMLKNYLSGV